MAALNFNFETKPFSFSLFFCCITKSIAKNFHSEFSGREQISWLHHNVNLSTVVQRKVICYSAIRTRRRFKATVPENHISAFRLF